MKIRLPKSRLIEVSKLRRNKSNVKLHPKGQVEGLAKLIEMVGFKDPIVIDKKLVVWAGHGRIDAAEHLGMKQVPCIDIDQLTISQKKAFMLMDNKINESDWNVPNVGLVLGEIPDFDFGEYHMDFGDMADVVEEEEPIPPLPEKPKSRVGDTYKLGKHMLVCGDSTKLPLPKPDMIYTDPPYGLGGYAGRSKKFDPIKNDDKDVAYLYLAIPDCPEKYVWANWKALSFMPTPRDIIVWKKNNFGMGRGYRNQYEICLYYGGFAGSDSDLWDVAKDNVADYNHPTQKPVELARRAISNSCKQGSQVLDMFAGAGSTLLACEQLDRHCYAIELDPRYVDVIIKRWENFTGKKAVKV